VDSAKDTIHVEGTVHPTVDLVSFAFPRTYKRRPIPAPGTPLASGLPGSKEFSNAIESTRVRGVGLRLCRSGSGRRLPGHAAEHDSRTGIRADANVSHRRAGSGGRIEMRDSAKMLFMEAKPAAAPAGAWVHRNYLAK